MRAFRWTTVLLFGAALSASTQARPSQLHAQSSPEPADAIRQDDDGPAPPFQPLLADPREVATYLTWLSWDAPWLKSNIASFGIGRDFPFARWQSSAGTEVVVSLAGTVLAQFDLDRPSFDFVNADFILGLPVSVRRGPWSARARFYHWSGHLGDEFLLRSGLRRRENAAEAIELLGSRDFGPLRVLAGGELRTRRAPYAMSSRAGRTGLEWHPPEPLTQIGPLGRVRGLAGLDVTWTRWKLADGWEPGISLRVGMEVSPDGAGRGLRSWAVQLEFYDGPSPCGQFFTQDLRTIGVGIHLR